jgi:glycosyltransferase involved in cell wall biosynthesis
VEATRLPRVSIVTPTLNQGAYVERAIRSVLEQDYVNLEYIVIDGGSTDGTLDVIRRYESQIAYWVSERDEGQVDAIEKGLAAATGELFAYINSDDYYLPGAVSALVRPFLDDAETQWSAGTCRYEHADGTLERLEVPGPPPVARRRTVDECWYVPQASSLWRTSVFDRVGGLRRDLHYVFDSEFAIRLVLEGIEPVFVDAEVATRYLHDDAKSASPERFAAEWDGVRRDLLARLGPRDLVVDLAYRAVRRLTRLPGGGAGRSPAAAPASPDR